MLKIHNDPSLRSSSVESAEPTTSSAAKIYEPTEVRIEGKFLLVNGKRFWIKGVTYGSFGLNDEGEPYPEYAKLKEDFKAMAEAGINTVRLYNAPSLRIADAAYDAGLMLIPEVGWAPRFCELDTPREEYLFSWAREKTRELAGHPSILMYSIGNEIPPLVVRWYGVERVGRFLKKLCALVKQESGGALVTYVNHPPTEYLNLPFFDVLSYNIYLERKEDFRAYLARLHSLAGDKPVFLAELGLDSAGHGQDAQAAFLKDFIRISFEKGLCGTAVYSWTDEWGIFDEQIEGWCFGLTDAERRPKPALEVVKELYHMDHYQMREGDWPSVTVVVATYNGSRTIAQCLESLIRLKYPDYEVLVIDDGSTDAVPEIVSRYPVRYHRVDLNSGLSNARNEGIVRGNGEIIAFIDDDAYADSDWLFFMVRALLEHGASAVGGPNLSPPDDSFTEQCVNDSPGNPTHVLLGDEMAEHVPGCNMAYLKSDLERIGMFDVTHRAAGDDVDVCWKLLVRQRKIAFSPAAIVWHHRRSTVIAYLAQQRGYGYAEAHLHKAYPSRFNVLGYSVWRGNIYDGHYAWSAVNMPFILKPRIYQGMFGSALFQAMYRPKLSSWLQLFQSIEWQLLGLCLMLSCVLSLAFSVWWVAAFTFVVGAVVVGAALVAGLISGIESASSRQSTWNSQRRFLGTILVGGLHIVQPWARSWGRVKGWLELFSGNHDYPRMERMWGNISQRDEWLRLLAKHLDACGWQCRCNDDWDSWDLMVYGPGAHTVRLYSVYEEVLHKGFHWVRFRVESTPKLSYYLGFLLILAAMVGLVMIPVLLPLALPLLLMAHAMILSRRHMENSVSQAALECGKALDMPIVEEEYLC